MRRAQRAGGNPAAILERRPAKPLTAAPQRRPGERPGATEGRSSGLQGHRPAGPMVRAHTPWRARGLRRCGGQRCGRILSQRRPGDNPAERGALPGRRRACVSRSRHCRSDRERHRQKPGSRQGKRAGVSRRTHRRHDWRGERMPWPAATGGPPLEPDRGRRPDRYALPAPLLRRRQLGGTLPERKDRSGWGVANTPRPSMP